MPHMPSGWVEPGSAEVHWESEGTGAGLGFWGLHFDEPTLASFQWGWEEDSVGVWVCA